MVWPMRVYPYYARISNWYVWCWDKPLDNAVVCAPVGLHWPVRWSYAAWWWVIAKYRPHKIDIMLHEAYELGKRCGRLECGAGEDS